MDEQMHPPSSTGTFIHEGTTVYLAFLLSSTQSISLALSLARSPARCVCVCVSLSSIAGIQALEIANAGKFLRKVSGCANGFIICYFPVCVFFPHLSFFPAPSGFGFSARKRDRQTDMKRA